MGVSESTPRPRGPRRRLFWQIFYAFLSISLVLMLVVVAYAVSILRSHYLDETRHALEGNAALAGQLVVRVLSEQGPGELNALCTRFKVETGMRYTVIRADGTVIADSDFPPESMENHRQRPEVLSAQEQGMGTALRHSETLEQDMLYVARTEPMGKDGSVIVRVARPFTEIESAVWHLQLKLAIAWIIASVLAVLAFLRFSQRIALPFERLKQKALSMVQNGENVSFELPDANLDEASGLSEAMNYMVNSLHERTSVISQQREELEAILAFMSEALLAVDTQGRVLKLNRKMAEVFGLDLEATRGHKIGELVRNAQFNTFVEEALKSRDVVQGELTFYSPHPLTLRGSGTRLRDAKGNVIGAVVVLNDITRIKRLEDLRKDFVANVSHELRTPITSIKGFVETLESGAMDDPVAARRFLGIISRQTNRLSNIIEDLLSLSKIEQHEGRWQLALEPLPLRKVLLGALRHCEESAGHKHIQLSVDCPAELTVALHASLFEQAIVNLVDNAVKYSESHRGVKISATRTERGVIVSVADQGYGIPRVHLPRLFERFYRVDKARSRDVGGTGLGLSIVKHITVAHGGSVHVESEVGQGSVFSLHLPA